MLISRAYTGLFNIVDMVDSPSGQEVNDEKQRAVVIAAPSCVYD